MTSTNFGRFHQGLNSWQSQSYLSLKAQLNISWATVSQPPHWTRASATKVRKRRPFFWNFCIKTRKQDVFCGFFWKCRSLVTTNEMSKARKEGGLLGTVPSWFRRAQSDWGGSGPVVAARFIIGNSDVEQPAGGEGQAGKCVGKKDDATVFSS